MTPAEFKEYVEITYDSIANSAAPGYEDDEINLFLNRAQERFCKSLYNADSNPPRVGFEESEKRSKDISELLRFNTISTSTAGNHPDSRLVPLPEGLWWVVKEEANITYTDPCTEIETTDRIPVKPVRMDFYNANIKNPYKKPDKTLVWRMDFSKVDPDDALSATNLKQHELVLGDTLTLSDYYLTYVKYPKAIDVSDPTDGHCELDPGTHRAIADMAVQLMLEAARQERLKTNLSLDQKIIE